MDNNQNNSQKRHQPFHLYLNNYIYFLTVHSYQNTSILRDIGRKCEFREKLKETTLERKCRIIAWVILDNHYHFMMKISNGSGLEAIFRKLHGATSFQWNKEDDRKGRKIWQNYWDYCIRDEGDYWKHFNYIHHNPVKHGYVKRMEDYEFSSFNHYSKSRGHEWIMSA